MYRRSRAYLVLSRSDRRDATGGGGDDLAAGTAHSVGPVRAEGGAGARVHGSRSRHVFVGFQVVPGDVADATVRALDFKMGVRRYFFFMKQRRPPSCPARTGSRRRQIAVFFGFVFGFVRVCRPPILACACGPSRLEGQAASVCAALTPVSDGPCARQEVRRGRRAIASDGWERPQFLAGGRRRNRRPVLQRGGEVASGGFVAFARDPEMRARLLFVNDGSTDGTLDVLRKARKECPERIDVLNLALNVGKAEAVRLDAPRVEVRGPHRCFRASSSFSSYAAAAVRVGFWDADLATPLDHVRLFRDVFADRPGTDMVFGARVGPLGRDIRRSARRHYVGRVFATLASLALRVPVYDTQCGAKLFRADGDLRAALSEPFDTRWVFDCELIGRYASLRRARDDAEDANGGASAARREKKRTRRMTTTESTKSAPVLRGVAKKPRRAGVAESIYEYPLHRWEDVAGSKVRPSDVVKMAWGLVRLRMKYFAREPWTPTRTPKSGARRAIGC